MKQTQKGQTRKHPPYKDKIKPKGEHDEADEEEYREKHGNSSREMHGMSNVLEFNSGYPPPRRRGGENCL